jgi:hypothetical protein
MFVSEGFLSPYRGTLAQAPGCGSEVGYIVPVFSERSWEQRLSPVTGTARAAGGMVLSGGVAARAVAGCITET